MISIREQILTKIMTALEAGNIGAPVYRSRTEAVSRSQSPCVIMMPGSDTAMQVDMPFFDWTLSVHVVVYVRDKIADQKVDPFIIAIHAAILADETLGGLVMSVLPGTTHYQLTDADDTACVATCEFRVRYRTSQQDLTQ